MREILFRGKRKDTDEWSYGSLQCFKGYSIFDNIWKNFVTVNSKTIGQYTGLVDKNGNKVFEGDILKYTPRPNCEIYYKVIWQQEYSRFAFVQWSTHKYQLYEWAEPEKTKYMCEVIGNIHDDPELLNTLEAK